MDHAGVMATLRVYARNFMFEVCLRICREDYVVIDDGASSPNMVQEVCKRISILVMEYRSVTSNRIVTDTPEDLYAKFFSVTAALPEEATVRNLALCNTYFSALTILLRDKMDDDKFRMPGLHRLATKTLQLSALRIVRSAAVVSFKLMANEAERICCLIPINTLHQGSHHLAHSTGCGITADTTLLLIPPRLRRLLFHNTAAPYQRIPV